MTSTLLVAITALTTSLSNAPQVKPSVCGLLPKAEVKKLIGASDAFDRVEPKEEPTKTGSSCRYSDLLIIVHEGDWSEVSTQADRVNADPAARAGRFETVPGVGQGAYIYNRPNVSQEYVDLFAAVGSRRLLTLSRKGEAGSTPAATRQAVIALAQALAAKLQ